MHRHQCVNRGKRRDAEGRGGGTYTASSLQELRRWECRGIGPAVLTQNYSDARKQQALCNGTKVHTVGQPLGEEASAGQ